MPDQLMKTENRLHFPNWLTVICRFWVGLELPWRRDWGYINSTYFVSTWLIMQVIPQMNGQLWTTVQIQLLQWTMNKSFSILNKNYPTYIHFDTALWADDWSSELNWYISVKCLHAGTALRLFTAALKSHCAVYLKWCSMAFKNLWLKQSILEYHLGNSAYCFLKPVLLSSKIILPDICVTPLYHFTSRMGVLMRGLILLSISLLIANRGEW